MIQAFDTIYFDYKCIFGLFTKTYCDCLTCSTYEYEKKKKAK